MTRKRSQNLPIERGVTKFRDNNHPPPDNPPESRKFEPKCSPNVVNVFQLQSSPTLTMVMFQKCLFTFPGGAPWYQTFLFTGFNRMIVQCNNCFKSYSFFWIFVQ